jgi:hypothetical protein
MCALGEPVRQLREACAESNDVVSLRFFFHVSFSSFHDFLVATLNFTTGVPFARCFVSAFLPTNPMIVS